MSAYSNVAVSASPYTGQQQIYEWPGTAWRIKANLPPMVRADAEKWVAFLLALRGRSGTFAAGDPLGKTPRGSAIADTVIPQAATIIPGARTIIVSYQAQLLKTGDYFQIAKNFLLDSRAFSYGANWLDDHSGASPMTVTPNNQTAPDGSATADTLSFPATAAGQWNGCQQNIARSTGLQGLPFYFSIWLKSSGNTSIYLSMDMAVTPYTGVNLSASVTASWQRFITPVFVVPDNPAVTNIRAFIRNLSSQGAKTIYAWGACVHSPTVDARLYKLTKDAVDDGSGNVTMDFFPPIRDVWAPDSRIICTNPVGTFRLAGNEQGWTEDIAKTYGVGFEAIEAI